MSDKTMLKGVLKIKQTIYKHNFQQLNQLFEGKLLSFITFPGYQQSFKTIDNKELIVDVLSQDESGSVIISLAQYLKQDNMLIINPEMRIKIDPSMEEVQVLSYQVSYCYIKTYTEAGEPMPLLTKYLSGRLKSWLKKIMKMNYKPIEEEMD